MRNVLRVLAAGLLTSIVGCDHNWPDKRTFLDSCEEVIKERLKSPSSYRRINDPAITMARSPISADEFENLVARFSPEVQETVRAMRLNGEGWVDKFNYVAMIEYDAANAFGTPLRRTSSCRSGTAYSGSPGRLDVLVVSVKVDGLTTTEWLADQARLLRMN